MASGLKALVTGANGFIGPHLVQSLLNAGHSVRCLVRKTSNLSRLSGLDIELAEGDVRAPDSLVQAVDNVDLVLHLASINKALDERIREQVNVTGTGNVAEACARRTSPPVLVVVSSLAAAGPSPLGRPRTEGDEPAPVSRYGRSKLGGELAAALWAGEVPTTIVRPPIVFGEGDPDLLSMVWPIARLGLHVCPGTAGHRFSLVHAADAAQGFLLAAQRGDRLRASSAPAEAPRAGVYFVANEEKPTYAELGRLIARSLGRDRVRVIRAPLAVAWLAGLAGEVSARLRGQAGIVNLDKAREASAGDWTCDTTRINGLGLQPGRPLPERLLQTAQWYRDQRWLPSSGRN